MRRSFALTLVALWTASVFNILPAQKHDYYMTLGYSSTPTTTLFGGTDIDFNTWPPTTTYVFREMDFDYNAAAICDEQGNLLFCTNGCSINGPDNQEILNGGNLNPGIIHNAYCQAGYLAEQGSTFVPQPGNTDRYYLFHLGLNFYDSIGGVGDKFYYTLIDKTLDNGHGGVVAKNQVLLEDTLAFGLITLTRHANGRDWWIVVPEMSTSKHYIFLLTPSGILGPKEQKIGDIHFDDDGVGNAVFSPDGTKYARFDWYNQLALFDFDRCTGVFSKPRHYSTLEPADTVPGFGGVAFSPNSRFLYISTLTKIYQYDTWAADLQASRQLIATFDGGIIQNSYTLFFMPQLGADGRIYICSASTVPTMHLIEWPDRLGTAATVLQRGLPLPTYNARTMCFFPNFRLGPVDDSSCDSLGLNNQPVANFRWNAENLQDSLKITFTDLSAYEPTDWHWDFGDGQTSQDTNPVHAYNAFKLYNVCLTVSNVNGSNTICKAVPLGVSAVEEAPRENPDVTVYPNPCSANLVITLAEPTAEKTRITMYDLLGRPLGSQDWSGQYMKWNISQFRPGVYWYRIQSSGKIIKTGSLVKVDPQ